MPDLSPLEVAIIDYGMGNLFSVKHACERVGLKAKITSAQEDILNSSAVILPGVGAFGDAMENLAKRDLLKPIGDFISSGKPFMGICLGMQLLMSESEEFGRHSGLDLIKGRVFKFSIKNNGGATAKVPQVCWNRINKPSAPNGGVWDKSPLSGLRNGEFMYFVHSYYCQPEDKEITLSLTRYAGEEYCSSMLYKNVFACQFHPEKSALPGLEVYKNWACLVKRGTEA